MTAPWTSGVRTFLTNVCANDLVEVRLRAASSGPGIAPAELPVAGYVPHLVYVPEFGHNRSDTLGGEQDKDDPNEWRVNLAPMLCPFKGGLYLDGGVGRNYTVRMKISRCRQVARPEWSITLRSIGAVPIQIPQGVWAIEAPQDVNVTLDASGDTLALALAAGSKFPLGHLSQGTIVSPAGTVTALTCHVRL